MDLKSSRKQDFDRENESTNVRATHAVILFIEPNKRDLEMFLEATKSVATHPLGKCRPQTRTFWNVKFTDADDAAIASTLIALANTAGPQKNVPTFVRRLASLPGKYAPESMAIRILVKTDFQSGRPYIVRVRRRVRGSNCEPASLRAMFHIWSSPIFCVR